MTSTKFQNGSLLKVKNKTTPDSWYFRFREEQAGWRVYRNLKAGSVRELPNRRDAEKAVLHRRANINSGTRTPETVGEAIAHYSKIELTPERKWFATLETVSGILRRNIAPTWGSKRLTEVRTVVVEEWLHSLPFAPATRTKIRNVFSALFTHAIRYEWIDRNPIQKVRASSARLADPDVLSPDEFRSLLSHLEVREKAMVIFAGSTGLRRSEVFALRWTDRFGATKTPASRKPVPLHESVATALLEWHSGSMYRKDGTSCSLPSA